MYVYTNSKHTWADGVHLWFKLRVCVICLTSSSAAWNQQMREEREPIKCNDEYGRSEKSAKKNWVRTPKVLHKMNNNKNKENTGLFFQFPINKSRTSERAYSFPLISFNSPSSPHHLIFLISLLLSTSHLIIKDKMSIKNWSLLVVRCQKRYEIQVIYL